MYKIYYNDQLICLCHQSYQSLIDLREGDLNLRYSGKTKFILSVLDKLEKNIDVKRAIIYFSDLKKLKEDFFSLFKIVKASGGLVLNKRSEMLLIFRRGNWDLPKGKMELRETKKEAALREVIEETGLKDVSLINKLITTYHIYLDKSGRRVLKPSYWYTMFTAQEKLIPQLEEDIEKAIWAKSEDITAGNYEPMYSSIRLALQEFSNSLPHS